MQSRRLALTLGIFVGLATASGQENKMTARQIVGRIQQQTGVALPATTVDTFKAGDPDTPVTGIAVTMMATFDVLQRAVAAGDNFVITHEPVFYNHRDSTRDLEIQADPVLAQKQSFIAAHHLVIWRFHDGWHARRPDGILLGMTKALGWEKFQVAGHEELFDLPRITVKDLAAGIQRKLQIRTLRVVGDPGMKVSKAAFLPGAAGSAKQISLLERPEVQVLLIGEAPEWETVEYVADAVSQNRPKALLVLGHIPSEQAGMQECAVWLRSFVSGVPVKFIPAEEPFWNPRHGF